MLLKRDLPSFSLYHNYSYLLTMSNKGETAEDEFQGTISKSPPQKNTPLLVYVLHKTQKIRHYHVLVAEKTAKKCTKKLIVIHVQNCCLAYETYRYQTFSLPSRSWILKTL